MIRFGVMDTLKAKHLERTNGERPGILYTALYGGIAGAASVFGNTPVDVVKTRMQVQCMIFLKLNFIYEKS